MAPYLDNTDCISCPVTEDTFGSKRVTLGDLAIVFPWLIACVGFWLVYRLIQQYGRILLRLEAIESQLGKVLPQPEPVTVSSGLELGSVAPAFELPTLAGQQQSLRMFHGRSVLLVFFNPQCGFCQQMAPDLAALGSGSSGVVPLVVTEGTVEANQDWVRQSGVQCPVVLQRQREVAELYQTNATPTGYLIDAQGNIASPLTAGAEGLLSLAQSRNTDVAATSRNGRGKQDKGLDASKINRNGLKAGAKAPAFNLRRLDGGQLALKELRGRRVLLVFSDPQCGPCEGLALRLEEIHRRSDRVQILMISRGDAELNRRKVAQSSLSFAVVLQKEWEISQLYGMFATPIGYLIDERGILLSDVAVGAEPILNLLSTHSGSSSAAGN